MRGLAAWLCVLVGLVGCGGEALPPPDVAASMAGIEVPYEAFEAYATRALGESDAVLSSNVLSGLFDQFLDELLLRRWAADELALEAAEGEDVLVLLFDSLPSTTPSEEELRRHFETNAADHRLPERVRLRQILVDTESVARQAHAELQSGMPFAEVADRFARHPYTPPGGDQGVLAREDLPPAFEAIVFSLEAGEFSDVVAADYGFHIFQVIERLPARSVPFEEARPGIERQLVRQLADAELAGLVARARNRYNVRVHRRNLPFNYDGRYLNTPRGS